MAMARLLEKWDSGLRSPRVLVFMYQMKWTRLIATLISSGNGKIIFG